MKYILILLFSISISAQFSVEKNNNNYTLSFEDGSKNELYQYNENGIVELVYRPMASLVLTEKEYIKFVKSVKKLMKKSEGSIESTKYSLDKFLFSQDEIFMATKTGSIATISRDNLDKL